jgi:hypothetical protein
MNRRARVGLAAALGIGLASCAHTPHGGKAQTFALDAGQAGRLNSGGRIVFANLVNDSRCPRGAQCAWAGTVTARFTLVPDPGQPESTSVLAVLPGGVSRAEAVGALPVDTLGVRITLLELTPYPEVGGAHAGARPRAIVRVEPARMP